MPTSRFSQGISYGWLSSRIRTGHRQSKFRSKHLRRRKTLRLGALGVIEFTRRSLLWNPNC